MYEAQITILQAELNDSKAERARLHERLKELAHLLAQADQRQLPAPVQGAASTLFVWVLVGLCLAGLVLLAIYGY